MLEAGICAAERKLEKRKIVVDEGGWRRRRRTERETEGEEKFPEQN